LVGQAIQDMLMARLTDIGTHDIPSTLPFKIVWIKDVQCLTKTTQKQLGILMEKTIYKLRFILSADSISSLLPSLRSRCLMLRIPQPSKEKIKSILEKILLERHISTNPL